MADDVQFARLEEALRKRREKYPNEDVSVSYRMACRELGIVGEDERSQYWMRITESGRMTLIGEWRTRGHRRNYIDANEDRHEAIHREFEQKPGAA